MLGTLLEQVVVGWKRYRGEIAQAYDHQKKVIDRWGLQISDIAKMLQTASSEKLTFV